jgi:hypothetical protein
MRVDDPTNDAGVPLLGSSILRMLIEVIVTPLCHKLRRLQSAMALLLRVRSSCSTAKASTADITLHLHNGPHTILECPSVLSERLRLLHNLYTVSIFGNMLLYVSIALSPCHHRCCNYISLVNDVWEDIGWAS